MVEENLNFDLGAEVPSTSKEETSATGPNPEEMKEILKQAEEFKKLPPLEQIKFVVAQKGIELQDPDPKCLRCSGSGLEELRKVDVSGTEETVPMACHCIFKKEDRESVFGPVQYGRKIMRKAEANHLKQQRKNRSSHFNNELSQRRKKEKKAKRKKLKSKR